jgi:spore coat polysaccharide biosynthesis predicted glycosyltransferase SpsG
MGLPSLQLILADNQTTAAMALESLGAAITIPLNNDLSSSIQAALFQLLQPQFLQTMQLASSQIVDGLGSQRVLYEVMNVE